MSGLDQPETLTRGYWLLDQRSPSQLHPAVPAGPGVGFALSRDARLHHRLYQLVGAPWGWTARQDWTVETWLGWRDQGAEMWIVTVGAQPAGFFELDPQPEGVVEITYCGLTEPHRGRGIGGPLVETAARRAWDLATRRPDRPPTRRVLLVCGPGNSPASRHTYLKCGFHLVAATDDPPPPRR